MTLLVASLRQGAGLEPNTDPRPVVKHTTLAPPGDHPGDRNRVVAGRVHEHEALGRYGFGVLVDAAQVLAASLGHGAKRLLQDRREAALFVAGGRVVVQAGAAALHVVLPPADALDEAFAHFAAGGPPGQQVFGAVDLGRLAEHGRTSVLDQQVRRHA